MRRRMCEAVSATSSERSSATMRARRSAAPGTPASRCTSAVRFLSSGSPRYACSSALASPAAGRAGSSSESDSTSTAAALAVSVARTTTTRVRINVPNRRIQLFVYYRSSTRAACLIASGSAAKPTVYANPFRQPIKEHEMDAQALFQEFMGTEHGQNAAAALAEQGVSPEDTRPTCSTRPTSPTRTSTNRARASWARTSVAISSPPSPRASSRAMGCWARSGMDSRARSPGGWSRRWPPRRAWTRRRPRASPPPRRRSSPASCTRSSAADPAAAGVIACKIAALCGDWVGHGTKRGRTSVRVFRTRVLADCSVADRVPAPSTRAATSWPDRYRPRVPGGDRRRPARPACCLPHTTPSPGRR